MSSGSPTSPTLVASPMAAAEATVPSASPRPSMFMRGLTIALVMVGAAFLVPFLLPLILAAWVADLVRPLLRLFERLLGGRRRSAAAIVVLLSIAVLVPLVLVIAAVVASVHEIYDQARVAIEHGGSVTSIMTGSSAAGAATTTAKGMSMGVNDWIEIATRNGANAWRVAMTVARASATVVLSAVVFVFALYTFTSDGERVYAWLEEYAPIPRDAFKRFSAAFRETGRGLFIGTGGTAALQGLVATITFVALGIPRAFMLGALTMLSALVPVLGTGIVWIPLTIELALAHDWPRAVVVLIVGLGVISTMDNVLRPILTRHGRLNLPSFVVLLSMLGGVATLGPAGALLGPLIVRLAVEALVMARENRMFRADDAKAAVKERSSSPSSSSRDERRQDQPERAALADFARNLEATTVGLDDQSRDVEAKT